VNENVLTDCFIDDAVWLEVDFPVVCYTDSIEFWWNVSTFGQFGKSRAEGFQLIQYVIRILRRVVESDIAVDIDEVLFCIRGEADAIALHSVISLACFRASAKAFLRGLLRPSRILFELWASILSSASDSWVCS